MLSFWIQVDDEQLNGTVDPKAKRRKNSLVTEFIEKESAREKELENLIKQRVSDFKRKTDDLIVQSSR